MKRLFAAVAITALLLAGCGKGDDHACYSISGRYFRNGIVLTDDGHMWEYETDKVSGVVSYDGMPVFVTLYNNGTKDKVADDIIISLDLRG